MHEFSSGSSQLSLQSLVRGGVSVEVILEYEIEGVGKGRLCSTCTPGQSINIYTQGCVDVDHGWPNNRVVLTAWYQRRRVKFCRVWGLKLVSYQFSK